MLKTKNVIAHMERLGHAGPRCLPEVKGLELAALTKQSPVESQYLCVSDTHCFTCLRHPRGDSPQTGSTQSILSWRVDWSSLSSTTSSCVSGDGEDGKSDSLWCIDVGGLRGRHFGLRGAVDEVGTPARKLCSLVPRNLGTRLGWNHLFTGSCFQYESAFMTPVKK